MDRRLRRAGIVAVVVRFALFQPAAPHHRQANIPWGPLRGATRPVSRRNPGDLTDSVTRLTPYPPQSVTN